MPPPLPSSLVLNFSKAPATDMSEASNLSPLPQGRTSTLHRTTGETDIRLTLDLDGAGIYDVDTGNGFLDHMVSQISRHGLIDITLKAKGDLHTGWHHLVEDVGITLGRALQEAIGDARGIRRMGHSIVPLDETLAMVALDCSGRGYAVVETTIDDAMVETLPGSLVRHFFESVALEGKINLHARIITGVDPHHKAEALCKAMARALRDAVEPDPRFPNAVPSTKGTLSG